MPRKAVDYNRTIIYKLVKNDDFDNANIYIGSTTEFIKRKSSHKFNCCNENSKAYNFKVYETIRRNGGWENWKMIEIEKFPCVDSREAEAREEYWRCEFNAKLNIKRPFVTQEQITEYNKSYNKSYNLNNADKNKQRRIENADYEKERHYKYRKENAEKLNKKYKCDCGGKYIHSDKSRHFKTKKHQNYINNKIETI
jgi:hypothetical protein